MPRYTAPAVLMRDEISRIIGRGFLKAVDSIIEQNSIQKGKRHDLRRVDIQEIAEAERFVLDNYIINQEEYHLIQRRHRRENRESPTSCRRAARLGVHWIPRESDRQETTVYVTASQSCNHLRTGRPEPLPFPDSSRRWHSRPTHIDVFAETNLSDPNSIVLDTSTNYLFRQPQDIINEAINTIPPFNMNISNLRLDLCRAITLLRNSQYGTQIAQELLMWPQNASWRALESPQRYVSRRHLECVSAGEYIFYGRTSPPETYRTRQTASWPDVEDYESEDDDD